MIVPVLLISSLLLGFVQAKGTEDKAVTNLKLGDQTIERTLQLRTHSIYAPYIDQDLQNRWWDFGADAYINTNKYIRLTRNTPSQMVYRPLFLIFTSLHSSPTGMAMVTSRIHSFQFYNRSRI